MKFNLLLYIFQLIFLSIILCVYFNLILLLLYEYVDNKFQNILYFLILWGCI